MRTRPLTHSLRRLQPLALASLLALSANSLNAAPRSFAGPGSFWDVVANWTGGILPGVGDDALLGAFNTELRTSFTINSFIGTGALTVSSAGTLSFASASSTGTLNLSGGSLAGSGALQVAGSSTWAAGTMSGTGTTSFNGDLALNTAGFKDITGGRTVNFNGSTTWTTTAASQGRIRTGSAVTLNNNGSWLDQNTLSNSISQDFGGPASTFVNAGTYTKSGNATTTIAIGFNNTASGAGTGVVNLNAGSLLLTGGGTSNGSFVGAAGTTLGFGGNHTLQAASSISTAGAVDFSVGTNTVAGSFNASTGTSFSGGTTTFTGTVSGIGSTITANGGTGVFNNTQAFNVASLVLSSGGLTFNNTGGVSTGVLNLSGGTLAGSSAVTVNGSSTWSAGTMLGTGTTTLNTDLALNTVGFKDIRDGRTVNFNGSTTWTTPGAGQGRIRTGGGVTLNNNGHWLDQNTLANTISQDFGGAASTFVNAGTYTKSGNVTTSINIGFNNSASGAGTGIVNVDAGTLQLGGGGSSNGSFAGAGTLEFSGGTHTLLAASSIANNNVVFSGGITNLGGSYNVATGTLFSGGTVNFTGSVANNGGTLSFTSSGGTANFSNSAGVQFSSLNMAAGTITGTQAVSFTGPSNWAAGTMIGSGSTTFASGLALDTVGFKDIRDGRTVNFNGTTTWTTPAAGQGRIRTGSAVTLNNNGTWLDQNTLANSISQDFGGAASTFVNAGTYTKSGNATTSIAIAFNNSSSGAGTGIVNVNAGTLQLGGGGSSNGSFAGVGTLEFSGGTNALLAASSIVNPNVVFSGGISNLAGSYNVATGTLFSGGTANFTGNVANNGGTLSFNSSGGTANFSNSAGVQFSSLNMAAGTISGTQAVTFTGASTWAAGTMIGSGSVTFTSSLALDSVGLKDIRDGRSVNFNGSTTWTTPAVGQGRIRTGSAATLNNNGSWLDQNTLANSISQDFGGATSTFVNAGSYTKSGNATTTIAINFDNTAAGVVNVNAGALVLNSGGNNSGSLAIASGSTIDFAGSTYTLGGSVSGSAGSRLLISGSPVSNTSSKNFGGLLQMTGGSLNLDAAFTTAGYAQAGGTVGGTGALSVTGPANWAAGAMTAAGSTSFASGLTLDTVGLKDITGGRTVNFNGSTTWTTPTVGQGRIRTGSAATLNNNGSWLDQNTLANSISQDFGGPASTFVNAGSYTKSGNATTTIAINYNNTGTTTVQAGTLSLTDGLSNFSGSTLSGGNFEVIGASTFSFTGANVVNNAAGITLDGAGSLFLNATNSTNGLANFASNAAAGSFNIRNGRNFSSAGAFGNAGTVTVGAGSTFTSGASFSNQATGLLQLAGGTQGGAAVANAGTVEGFGTLSTTLSNSGTLRASGGTLAANLGVQGVAGAVQVLAGATLNLAASTASSSAATLALEGGLALGAQAFDVFGDYNNANFGSGNSFVARANVSGSGAIVGVNAALSLTGDVVANGANAYVLNLGTVRGGSSSTRSFQVAHSGTGASIRGALQTGGPGLGNLSDARLSGSGTVATNFGAITAGTSSGSYSITLDASGPGGALSGQSLAVLSNFGNVATQTVALTGFSTVLAQGAATPAGPLDLGNFRVGLLPVVSTTLAVSNLTTGAGAERLGLASATASGNFSASNNLGSGFVVPGATAAGAVTVASSGSAVGVNNGSVVLQFNSNGQLFDNSFANLASNQQTVAVQATGFLTAQPALPVSVALGNFRLIDGASSAFTLSNTNLAPAGFQEVLNASAGSTSAGVTLGGSVTGLAPGASSQNLVVGFAAGGSAGPRNGNATVNIFSDGTGTSGLGLLDISRVVGVSGTGFNLAQASNVAPSVVALGDLRAGGLVTQALSFTNLAAADGFSERLTAGISSIGNIVSGGNISLLAAGASSNALFVGVDTSIAGAKSGAATITLASDGSGTSGFSPLALGTQLVAVSANVYRLAQPVVDSTPLTLVGRVGDATLQAGIAVTNNAPDLFTERLNASIAASPAGTNAGPTLVGLAPNASGNLALSLPTSASGSFSGPVGVALVSSSAGTSSGAPDLALGTVNVAFNGRVYAPALAQLPLAVVDFGTVRVGDAVAARGVTVSNAATGALTDTLRATISGGTAVFSSGGTVVGLAAGSSNSTGLQVQMATTTAGVFSGNASVQLSSRNPELPDLALAPVGITLQGQVNHIASAAIAQAGGSGSFSGTAFSYTLDFGTVVVDTGTLTGTLNLANAATGTADALAGSWNLAALAGGPFSVAGFEAFTGLAAGSQLAGLTVSFEVATEGSFSRTVVLNGLSTNGSGPDLSLNPITLQLQGTVVAVPEPGTYLMMAVGVLAMGSIARRKLRAAPENRH